LENACGAIAQLTLSHPLKLVIAELNGLEHLSKLLLTTTSDKLKITTAQALYDLSWLPEGHTVMKSRAVLDKLVEMLRSESIDVQLAAATALYSPSYEPEVMEPIMPELLNALNGATDPRLLVGLLESLVNLAPTLARHFKPLKTQQKLGELLKADGGQDVFTLAANILATISPEANIFLDIVSLFIPNLIDLLCFDQTPVRCIFI